MQFKGKKPIKKDFDTLPDSEKKFVKQWLEAEHNRLYYKPPTTYIGKFRQRKFFALQIERLLIEATIDYRMAVQITISLIDPHIYFDEEDNISIPIIGRVYKAFLEIDLIGQQIYETSYPIDSLSTKLHKHLYLSKKEILQEVRTFLQKLELYDLVGREEEILKSFIVAAFKNGLTKYNIIVSKSFVNMVEQVIYNHWL